MKYGIVDVGSNTIRLSVYNCGGHDFKLLMNKKVTAGLAGYIKSGELSDAGILVACHTLCSFRELAQNIGVDGMSVFGTAPLRNIVNTEEAVNTIKSVTGISIDVLSGADVNRYPIPAAAPDSSRRSCLRGFQETSERD